MATNNIIGLAVGLDTSSLKAGLADAGRRIKEAGAEFQAATAEMDDWRKSTVGLNAKLKQLNSNLAVQEEALKLMEKEYEDAGYAQDDMSSGAVRLRTQISKQKAAIGKTKKEISQYSKELENLEEGTEDTTDALEAQKEAVEKVDAGFTTLKGTIAGLLTAGIAALISGLAQGAKALLDTSAATREYREDMGKLQAAFESAGKSSESATDTYRELYRAIGETDTAVEASQQIALLAKSEEDAAKWADLATGVVGKFGDALKPETFYEAANETLNLGTATGAFTQMLEQSGLSVDEFNEGLAKCTTEQDKQNYMLAVSQGALGKAGEAYEELNADIIKVRDETAEYEETQAKLGEKMEGVNGTLQEFKNDLLNVIMEEVDFDEVAQTLNETLTKFKDEIIPKIIEGFKWLKDHLPEIKAAVVGIGAAFAAWKIVGIVNGIVKAFKAWQLATQGMTIAQKLLNLAMKANPIGIIISLVAGLIAYLIYLWNTNEDFRKAVIKIWESIKQAYVDAWEGIKKLWSKAGEFFSGIWKGIKNAFSAVGTWFKTIFTDAWNAVKKVFSKVGSFFSGIWTTIKETFANIGQKVGDAISSTFKKAVNGLLSTAEAVLNKPVKAINTAIGLLNEVPGVNIGKLSEFELPRMAKGGIVNGATLGIVGEDGAEAVVPLEKNLGWIKKLSANIVKEMNPNMSGISQGITTNNTTQFTQIINAPKQPALDDLYRQSKNLLNLKVGG